MIFEEYIESFAGLPIAEYVPGEPLARSNVAYRVFKFLDEFYGERKRKVDTRDFYEHLFQSEGIENVSAFVFGYWGLEGPYTASVIVEPLVRNAASMPGLRALFLGDIIDEDCQAPWIEMDDISSIWKAFPQLETLWLRGSDGLSFGRFEHHNLRELVIQCCGLSRDNIQQILNANLPNLEHLELWLGISDFGGDSDVNDFTTLFSGALFPNLKYLGLCNADDTDSLAQAIADAPILDRIETLDLSNGTLSDVGAEALLRSEKVKKLNKLDLHFHYLSDEKMQKFSTLPCEVDTNEQQDCEMVEELGMTPALWR